MSDGWTPSQEVHGLLSSIDSPSSDLGFQRIDLTLISEQISKHGHPGNPADRAEALAMGAADGPVSADADQTDPMPLRWWMTSPPRPEAPLVEYWARRARESRHPQLKGRYAALAWEFQVRTKGLKPEPELATARIDAVLAAAAAALFSNSRECWATLDHALSLAARIRDDERTASVVNAMVTLDEAADDDKPGTWGAFRRLLMTPKKKRSPKVEDATNALLVQLYEDRLRRLAGTAPASRPSPFSCKDCAKILARYYAKKQKPEDVARVLRIAEAAFRPLIEATTPIQAQGWLRDLHDEYDALGIAEEAKRLRAELDNMNTAVIDAMGRFRVPIEFPAADVKAFVDSLLVGEPGRVAAHVFAAFLPTKRAAEEHLRTIQKTATALSLFPKAIRDQHGRDRGVLGSIRDDPEGNLIWAVSQDMQLMDQFLAFTLDEAATRGALGPDQILELAARSACFLPHDLALLQIGVRAHYTADFITSIHVLIPRLEAALRGLLVGLGGSPTRPKQKANSQQPILMQRPLGDVLNDDILLAWMPSRDIPLYLRVLLTEQAGANLRNDVAHGLIGASGFTFAASARLVHALLFLVDIRDVPDVEEE